MNVEVQFWNSNTCCSASPALSSCSVLLRRVRGASTPPLLVMKRVPVAPWRGVQVMSRTILILSVSSSARACTGIIADFAWRSDRPKDRARVRKVEATIASLRREERNEGGREKGLVGCIYILHQSELPIFLKQQFTEQQSTGPCVFSFTPRRCFRRL
jgi:hypothetical protein